MQTNTKYDVVVIGGGLGGILTAVLLSKEGMNVCVVEQDKQIGGCLQTFSVQKKVFDSCVHYIGGLGDGHTLNRIFTYAGIMDKLELKAYDTNAFDKVAFGMGANEYPLAQGFGNFQEQLLEYFPHETMALREYINRIKTVGDHFPLYRLRMGDADEKAAVSNWGLTDTLNEITDNPLLQSVLTGNNLLYAGVKNKTPFYLHALVTESYIHSSHKVLPGSSQISKYLWQELQNSGGTVLRNTAVTKVVEADGNITHIETEHGEQITGTQFISNVHPQVLLGMLDSKIIRPAYRKRIDGLQQTTSTYMLNLVLTPGTVPMRHHNLYWNATTDVWAAAEYAPQQWPVNYALFFTEDKDNPGYAESLSILSYMHYSEVSKWDDSYNRTGHEAERGDAYETIKAQKAEQLLNKVYERVPELKGNITAQKAATPLTYRDYTGTPKGALYGILKDVNKPAETTIATRTKIPNLLQTGQNVNLHGVLGVSITALATTAELVGLQYLLDKVKP
ncbi:MAG: NAD(P)/FAD-dependent oxidoreductase [Chitinophagales bacterium]|nr:NAD(P)/FAD-dependent oxidoreductase [Chitinophagaceae bacterium]MCB9065608.1 NAD(P)/FAD-dependent oxidoreductase [Chitinophagales bacterium]